MVILDKNSVIVCMGRCLTLFFLFSIIFISCSPNSSLDQTLKLAGDNRTELEKVLIHYQDSGLKYDAARFLLEHMPGCQGTDSVSLEKVRSVYDAYDSINRASGYETDVVWGEQIDSLADMHSPLLGLPPGVMDLHHVKSEYLIREIERSFQAWERNVYAKDASFEDFCEYVLPYRRLNGLVADHARDTFFHRHNDEYYINEGKHWRDETDSLLYEYRYLTHSGFRGTRIPVLRAETFEYLRHGLCMHRCWYNSLLLSSLGMPAAIDFVPAWGNRNNSHSWNVVIVGGESYAFEAFWDADRWKYKRIYNNRNIDHLWGKFRLPKVYRYTYSNHIEGPVADSKVAREDIPPLFRNIKKKDVSFEYFETHDVTLKLTETPPDDARYAYLAVFGYQQWHPVQWGRIGNDRTVTFRGMGKDIVYLPVYYKHGRTIPAASPFKLESDGTVCMLQDDGVRENVHLRVINGAPVCDANRLHFNRPRGSRWVGLKDGKEEEKLHVWTDSLTLKYSEVSLSMDSSYRYVRMYLRDDTLSMGEVSFHSSEGKVPSVKVLTKVHTFSSHEGAGMLTDGIEATACYGLVPERYVDFDLGAEYKLTGIGLYPYLKSELTEGDYELMYWSDGSWKALEMKTADATGFLEFEDVPTSALLMLKDRNKGWGSLSSERIFICREGGHICWE